MRNPGKTGAGLSRACSISRGGDEQALKVTAPKYQALLDTCRTERASGRTFDYLLVGRAPYVRRDGQPSIVLTWRSHCAVCGEPFHCLSAENPKSLTRTCIQHRRMMQRRRG